MVPIILASNSPRRRELLSITGLPFIVMPVDVDESPAPNENVESCVLRLSEMKARAAHEQSVQLGFPHDQIIVAADTLVVYQSEILGKPRNITDAKRMLELLRNKTHQVITGITITTVGNADLTTDVCSTDVPMRDYGDDELAKYVNSGDPMDKAGAYAIQNTDFHPVNGLSGCFASVMGLPLCHLARSIMKFDLKFSEDIPSACQEALHYTCPVFASILDIDGTK